MDGVHRLPKYLISLENVLQLVLRQLGKAMIINEIKLKYTIKYAHIVIAWLNKYKIKSK